MTAKNAELKQASSHHIGEGSHNVDGIGKEEVYLCFSATWRGSPVTVTMSCDRYSASFHDEQTGTSTNRLTNWRAYAADAHYEDPTKNGGRGAPVSETARSALSKLCQPFAMDWLASDAYTVSFHAAIGRMIMRKFRDDYSAARYVSEALATFRDRLPLEMFRAIGATLTAYQAYEENKAAAELVINGGTR